MRKEYAGAVKMLTILYLILSVMLGYFALSLILITTLIYVVVLIIYTGLMFTKCADIIINRLAMNEEVSNE